MKGREGRATFRARCVRTLVKHSIGRMYRKAGHSVPELRKLDAFLIRSQRLPKGTEVTPVALDGVRGEWVRGRGARTDATILYLHGGAFVAGSSAIHREMAARISASAGFRVLSPDYRLAPEHPFPAAVEDVLSAYGWLLSRGYPAFRVVLGGDSSGGGLALQALLTMTERGYALPKAAFFLSPVADWIRFDGESYATGADLDPLLSPAQCRFTASLYVGESPRDTPLLRPLGMDLSGLPPLWIQAGDREIILSDAERLAHRAREAGVDVDMKIWPGLWHVFQSTARMVPEARDSLDELGRFIKRHLPRVDDLDTVAGRR